MKIRQVWKQKRLTAAEISTMSGVHPKSVEHMIHIKFSTRKHITYDMIKVCNALNIPITDLIDDGSEEIIRQKEIILSYIISENNIDVEANKRFLLENADLKQKLEAAYIHLKMAKDIIDTILDRR